MRPGRHGKSIRGTIRRASVLPIRYGLTPDKILGRLGQMASVLDRWESVATIPVTAVILDRHPEAARQISQFDVGIHGYRHVPCDELSREEQATDLDRALATVARHGLTAQGFRAPYLRPGASTNDVLRRRGMLWNSSRPMFLLPDHHAAASMAKRLAGARYRGIETAPARPVGSSPVELPVAMPDDEILVDGLGISNPASLTRVFDAMLDQAVASGSLLTLQIHPERFHLFAEAIRQTLQRCQDLGGWIASLTEVATWAVKGGSTRWPRSHSTAVAVTGDLDAVVLGDFVRRVGGDSRWTS
jgi:hypothetical protein